MQGIKISFEIKSLPFVSCAYKGEAQSLEIKADEGTLLVALRYDVKEKPLILCGEAMVGDFVELNIFDYIIELRINGKTVDEDWPYGKALFELVNECYAPLYGFSPLSEKQIAQFIKISKSRPGAEELITPREIIRDYLTLLNILKDNPEVSFAELIGKMTFSTSPTALDIPEEAAPTEEAAPQSRKVDLFDIEI